MKTNKLLPLAGMLALALASPAIAAERVIEASELPPQAKKTFEDSLRGETVKKIAVRNAGGRTVYDVEFERTNADDGRDRLRIAEDGKILGDTRKAADRAAKADPAATDAATPTLPPGYPGAYPVGYPYEPYAVTTTQPRLRIEDLPRAAQETIRRESADRDIAVIHEETVDGRKAYVAQFRESGRNPRVYVAEDGGVLRPTEKPPALALGTTFSDTPAPVQQAIRRELGEGEIVRIDKDKGFGETESYKVEVKDGRGNYRLRVAPDGKVLENTRKGGR